MEFQRARREDPERIFMVVRNSYSTASLTNGQWCSWDIVTDKDGFSVTKPAGVNRYSVAGVVVEAIPHAEYGLAQVWGYKADARCLGGSGSVTSKISGGTPLYFATSGFAAQAPARLSAVVKGGLGKRFFGNAIEPLNTAAIATFVGTSGAYEVLIRCL